MKLLLIADYPRPTHEFSGIFNQRCVRVLKERCDRVEVIAHRPYVPSVLARFPRWREWKVPNGPECVDGVYIHRPAYLQVPRIASAFWVDKGAFFWCRRTARELHHRFRFDAILSFDLFGAGGLAWRVGSDLNIPAIGWATGSDLRKPAGSNLERVVTRTIRSLDLVFYQSLELFKLGARLLGVSPHMMPKSKHVVLPRGIPEPPSVPTEETRKRTRSLLGLRDDEILVLAVGSILRGKGVFELLDAISLAARQDRRIYCVFVGSLPAVDETRSVEKILNQAPSLRNRAKLLPACSPENVWEYLFAADIFAFASHNEGMPNSLLEAMAVGLPSVAFGIPAVLEIKGTTGALVPVPPLDSNSFAEALLRLARSSEERALVGKIARNQVMKRFMVRNNMAEALRHIDQVVEERKPVNAVHTLSSTDAIRSRSQGYPDDPYGLNEASGTNRSEHPARR